MQTLNVMLLKNLWWTHDSQNIMYKLNITIKKPIISSRTSDYLSNLEKIYRHKLKI